MKELCKASEIIKIFASATGLLFIILSDGKEITTDGEVVINDGIVYEEEWNTH